MKLKQYDIWLAGLNPRVGTEPGKTRPVVIIQTDLLNEFHPSALVCHLTSKVNKDIQLLRVHLKKGQLNKPSNIFVDQIRAIDNNRLKKRLGALTKEQILTLKTNIRIVLDI